MYNFINCISCCSMLSLILLLRAPWAAKIFLIGKAYLRWSLCILYLHACQVIVTVGDSGLCCTCVTYFER